LNLFQIFYKFGQRYHQDDITINIPTVYPEEEFEDLIYNHNTTNLILDVLHQDDI